MTPRTFWDETDERGIKYRVMSYYVSSGKNMFEELKKVSEHHTNYTNDAPVKAITISHDLYVDALEDKEKVTADSFSLFPFVKVVLDDTLGLEVRIKSTYLDGD